MTPPTKVEQPNVASNAKAKHGSNSHSKTDGVTECQKGADHRLLTLSEDSNKCTLLYKKYSKESVAGTATHDLSYCRTTRDRIKSHLESAGFKCQ